MPPRKQIKFNLDRIKQLQEKGFQLIGDLPDLPEDPRPNCLGYKKRIVWHHFYLSKRAPIINVNPIF